MAYVFFKLFAVEVSDLQTPADEELRAVLGSSGISSKACKASSLDPRTTSRTPSETSALTFCSLIGCQRCADITHVSDQRVSL